MEPDGFDTFLQLKEAVALEEQQKSESAAPCSGS